MWRILASMLAVIVTFVTTYSLILPAITVSVVQVEEVDGLYLGEDDDGYEIVEDNEEQYEQITPEADTLSADFGTEDILDGELIEDEDQPAETESEIDAAGIELWVETETETETETEIESETETVTETDGETESELTTEAESETEIETETEEETDAETGNTTAINTRSAIDKNILASDGKNYKVTVTYGAEAMIPEGAELKVEEILPGENSDREINGGYKDARSAHKDSYEEYVSRAQDALNSDEKVTFARFFDICIVKDGTEIQPSGEVDVRIELADDLSEDVKAVHFGDEVEVLDAARVDAESLSDAVEFTASGFSVYGIVGTTIEKIVLASDGHNYHITVTYGPDAGIPDGVELEVEEILSGMELYEEYASKAESALELETGTAEYIRLFDIKIVDKDDHSKQYQPEEGKLVDVRIELADSESAELSVVHFADVDDLGEVVETATKEVQEGTAVEFSTQGFSVYAVVDAHGPVDVDVITIRTLEDLDRYLNEDTSFYLSITRTDNSKEYVSDTLRTSGSNSVFPVDTSVTGAGDWHFVKTGDGTYKLYVEDNGVPKYLRKKGSNNNNAELTDNIDNAAEFEANVNEDGTFRFKIKNVDAWFNYSGGGGGMRFWNKRDDVYNNNPENSKITITLASSYQLPVDPYGLDGQTYGIVYNKESATGAALMGSNDGVSAETLIVKHDVLYHTDTLLVAQGSNISLWTFENVSGDQYNLFTIVDGVKQYLTINGSTVSLTPNEPDPVNSLITVTPGTDENSGKIRLTVNGYDLNAHGKTTALPISGSGSVFSSFDGFEGKASASSTYNWLNLAKVAENISDEDFAVYTAKKVSVSHQHSVVDLDEEGHPIMIEQLDDNGNTVLVPQTHMEYDMPDGAKVVMYTRIWNDDLKKYDFFVVDYDGTLLPAYDEGDMIEWTGTQYNTASLEFTEYHNTDGTPNYYYELENYYGKYFAPNGNGILSDNPVGINMNGRRFGYDYTPIIAWDSRPFKDWGFEIEDGKLVSRRTNQPEQDFYFAIVQLPESTLPDQLTTVDTVDNVPYGITMRMIDFNNSNGNSNRDPVQNPFFKAGGKKDNEAGILSSQLIDGYPANGVGTSLSELFTDMTDVNHLFIESIHNESGYFEYDSTQNFARLFGNNFTVYNQLGAIDNTTTGPTRTHGQFMPYNDLNVAAADTLTNQTDISGNLLSDLDPRKGEKLYPLSGTPDHFFGMEMGASFTQTANGLDDWGNDIIFEFSGDDDFWLYVDDELVLDLGGIHSAMSGKVNFRTGVINSSRPIQIWDGSRFKDLTTYTLRQVFETNYRKRYPNATNEDVLIYLRTYFNDGEDIFKDYTNHSMKVFYMERGAGASNLHMRFNLAAVKPGRVVLKKELSGVSSKNFSQVKFPYQIWYRLEDDNGNMTEHLLQQNKTGQSSSGDYTGGSIDEYINVFYENTNRQVDYMNELTINGTEYENVFLLKPGESAEIDLPDNAISYRIIECGIDTGIYDEVKVNNNQITGTPVEGTERCMDFDIDYATSKERPRVTYDNHVNSDAIHALTITKKLFKEDGSHEIIDDPTLFKLRLYIGDSLEDESALALADRYEYRLKNRDGAYCYWDLDTQSFVPFEPAVTDFNDLTPEQKVEATLNTSMYGMIDNLPSGFTVEVPDLLVGTRFRVVEREEEIPDGYSLQKYQFIPSTEPESPTPVNGVIRNGEVDPHVEVDNLKGWGLRINKIWTDADFMDSHDPIYFAVYIKGELDKTKVRQMSGESNSVYWYFERLAPDTTIDHYVIKEVKINPAPAPEQVDLNGHVTLAPGMEVLPVEEAGTLGVNGIPAGESTASSFEYRAHYDQGTVPEDKNIRIDTVTNSRPGIKLYKTDWEWDDPLPDAVFSLKKDDGTVVGTPELISDENGFVTTIYLDHDGVYNLSETSAPSGYQSMSGVLTLTQEDGSVTVSGDETDYYEYNETPDADDMARITVRNRKASLRVVKIDKMTGAGLEGVEFELHLQAENDQTHEMGMVNRPMDGYESLVSDSNGIIPRIDLTLPPATYYLKEKAALPGYGLLSEPLCFTITPQGEVSVQTESMEGWLTVDDSEGEIAYTIRIPNEKVKKVSFKKVDISTHAALEGARFELYRVIDRVQESMPMFDGMVSNSSGMLAFAGSTIFELENGIYHLIETEAPENYQRRPGPVVVTVSDTGVTYGDETTLSGSNSGVTYDSGNDLYTLMITNSSGYALPSTGGSGTALFYLLGGILLSGAGILLLTRLRMKRKHSER